MKSTFEVYAVKQREKNYSICDFDKNWYSGWGQCPVAKGHHVEVEWVQEGDFRNIKLILPAQIDAVKNVKPSSEASIDVQKLIIRQSCLKAATELICYFVPVKESKEGETIVPANHVITIAESFEKWVNRE